MRRLKLIIVFLLLVFCGQVFAGENEGNDLGFVKYIPYAIAIIIYILGSKLKPKGTEENKPFSGLIRKRKQEIGPKDTSIVYDGYERNYEPIEPK